MPLALSPDDYIELLPATWRAVNAYGIKISRRVYDGKELNPLRMQHSGVTARNGLHEVHYDPYDISRVWVRDHWNGGWITVFWTQLHRVAAPFGELAWDHARKLMPAATEAELADAVQDLLTRAGQGPGHGNEPAPSGKRTGGSPAAPCLAVISGSTIAGIKNALPAFGGKRGHPVRAVTARRLCTAARRIRQPVPVHLPACHQVCLRHGIWLSGPGTPQFSARGCPDILDAERRARRLLRRCTTEQLIYARIQAPADQAGHAWKRRTAALIESNPRSVTETSPQALFQAAAYPDAIAAACASRKSLL